MLFFMQNGKMFGRQKHRKRLIIEGCKVCCDVATGNHLFLIGCSRRVLLTAGVIKKIYGGRQNYETTAF